MEKRDGCWPAFVAVAGAIAVLAVLCVGVGIIYVSRHIHFPMRHPAPPPEVPAPIVPQMADIHTSGDGALVRDRSLRLSGRYEVTGDIRLGKLRLERLSAGPAEYFDALENGGAASLTSAPLVLVFGDTTTASAAIEEDTGTSYVTEVRVVCRRYTLTRETIACDGGADGLGKVAFRGRLNPAFAAKIAVTGGPETAFFDNALSGDLTAGGQTVRAVSLAYWRDE